jgi:hypothetical protein
VRGRKRSQRIVDRTCLPGAAELSRRLSIPRAPGHHYEAPAAIYIATGIEKDLISYTHAGTCKQRLQWANRAHFTGVARPLCLQSHIPITAGTDTTAAQQQQHGLQLGDTLTARQLPKAQMPFTHWPPPATSLTRLGYAHRRHPHNKDNGDQPVATGSNAPQTAHRQGQAAVAAVATPSPTCCTAGQCRSTLLHGHTRRHDQFWVLQ